MEKSNPGKSNCIKCETRGVVRKARVLVNVDGLTNSTKHPLCKSCAKEWREDYMLLQSVSEADPALSEEFKVEEITV